MPADEYEPEAETILVRLNSAESIEDTERIAYEEFCWWFGKKITSRVSYRGAAEKIWELWRSVGKNPV